MHWTADTLDYFAGLVTEIKGETSSQGPRHLNLTRRQPYGVVAKLNPFNHPFRFCAEKAAAPLAAGNCVVIKSSEQAPISRFRLAELADGIFPPGVVNVIAGDGRTGAALVSHPLVSRDRLRGLGGDRAARGDRRGPGAQAREPRARRQEPDHHLRRRRPEEGRRRRGEGHEHEPAGAVVQLHVARLRARVAAPRRGRRRSCGWPRRCPWASRGSSRTSWARSSRAGSTTGSWATSPRESRRARRS